MSIRNPRLFLRSLFDAAVLAADPLAAMRRHLPYPPKGRTVVIGAGKASSQMAAALETIWSGSLEGLVVTRYGCATACRQIEIIEAAHPLPDSAGLMASRRLLDMVSGLGEDDLVIALISGGGSALLPAPAGRLNLQDEIAVNEVLLSSGAPISAMNTIRKSISSIKGGRLAAAAYPARVVTFVVSDVPGDDPALVASGPTIASPGSREQALASISLYGMRLPGAVIEHLKDPCAQNLCVDDLRFTRNAVHVVASTTLSLEAAAEEAQRQGIAAFILSDSIEGEARDVASVHAAIAREIATRGRPFPRGTVLLSGGETTVTLKGTGKGGRNCEFLLSFAAGIQGLGSIYALAADTDGIDGTEDNAGAYADGTTIERMRTDGIDANAMLHSNDAWTAFDAVGDLLVTGPTGTNVNDFRAILVG